MTAVDTQMLSPSEILAAAERKWPAVLRAEASGEILFPLQIPFGRPKTTADFADLKRDIEALASAHVQWTIEWQIVSTRKWGRQRWPVRVLFDSADALATALGRREELKAVRSAIASTREVCPSLEQWLHLRADRIPAYVADWSDLLSVCRYFNEHPAPHCFPRQVPLPISTKFIENNAGILRELLDVVLGDRVNAEAAGFEERFHLLVEPPQIRFRFLDSELQRRVGWPVSDCAVPLPAFAALDWTIDRILIVENRNVFLCLPNACRTLAIFGSGKAALLLSACKWMSDADLIYWGDCDEAGYGILSDLRASFPRLRSVLMDVDSWERWKHLATLGRRDTSARHIHLSPPERAAFDEMLKGPFMLEQERIPPVVAAEAIAKAFQPMEHD